MTKDQLKHLQARVAAAKQKLQTSLWQEKNKPKKPAAVTRAEETIAAWNKKSQDMRDKLAASHKEAVKKAEEKLFFSDEKEALKAVQALEAFAEKEA